MNHRKIKLAVLFLIFFAAFCRLLPAQAYMEFPLSTEQAEDGGRIRVYLPEVSNGKAVIVCPGGGYRYLEMNKEGYAYASWFNERGIACVVLRYRLPKGQPELPLQDAEQAIRLVRAHASEWNIRPDQVGIMGSSAGGHVASTLATHFNPDTRPDFQILLYPVITMNPSDTHKGSLKELLGQAADDTLIRHYSNEEVVKTDTPPAFIALSDDDNIVPSLNSINYYLALKKQHISCELHVYPTGGHGWGMNKNFLYYNQLTASLDLWLRNLLLLENNK